MPIEQVHTCKMPDTEQSADLVRRARVALLQAGDTGTPEMRSAVKLHGGLGYVVLLLLGRAGRTFRARPGDRNGGVCGTQRNRIWIEKHVAASAQIQDLLVM